MGKPLAPFPLWPPHQSGRDKRAWGGVENSEGNERKELILILETGDTSHPKACGENVWMWTDDHSFARFSFSLLKSLSTHIWSLSLSLSYSCKISIQSPTPLLHSFSWLPVDSGVHFKQNATYLKKLMILCSLRGFRTAWLTPPFLKVSRCFSSGTQVVEWTSSGYPNSWLTGYLLIKSKLKSRPKTHLFTKHFCIYGNLWCAQCAGILMSVFLKKKKKPALSTTCT